MFYKQNNNTKSIVMEKLDFSEYDIDIDKIYNKEKSNPRITLHAYLSKYFTVQIL